MDELIERWRDPARAAGATEPAAVERAGARLLAAWREPHRRYHTVDDPDGALLCDADLAVLAAPPDAYDHYAAAIRDEYAHVADADFRAGRAAVLASLLALPALYRLPALHRRWEAVARANLSRELAALGAR
ncbi:hypothetical protein GA0074695_0817 [Micromonospora viridifaciens]|uniref:Uncharacterized protein n=1 Tax=Micromonospora viridifaciens TaxID=1881 RepID=A0A1C4UU19_MICVI|nr:hypothetical protein [Micromonospora viridifaciens]SCE75115.1 hypothetical protein GA0074695_0817 [Micromonospora viridifaciens]